MPYTDLLLQCLSCDSEILRFCRRTTVRCILLAMSEQWHHAADSQKRSIIKDSASL